MRVEGGVGGDCVIGVDVSSGSKVVATVVVVVDVDEVSKKQISQHGHVFGRNTM